MKKILIIGAGFLQAYVIKAAKAAGYITGAVDANKDAVGFKYCDFSAALNIVDKEACLKYAKENNIDGVMTAATDFGAQTAAYIASELKLPGLSCETAQTVKNKYLTRKVLFEAKADDSQAGFEVSDILQLIPIKSELSYPVMVKPCDGSGSRGASKVSDDTQLEQACIEAMKSSLSGKAVIEHFINGVEYGVETFVYGGIPHVLAVMKKWMTKPPYYAELGHAIPSGLDETLENRVKTAAAKAITALGISVGAVNMDVIVSDNGTVHIIDIGARMGGNLIGSHIIPIGTGYDYMASLVRSAVGDKVTMPNCNKGRPVATRLLALAPGTVASLPDFKEIEELFDVKIEHHLKAGDVITPYRTNLDGCGYVIATADTADAAANKAQGALSAIDKGILRK